MNKSKFLLFAFAGAMLAVTFVACSGKDDGPQDHTLTDKGVFTANGGVFNGSVTIQNTVIGSPRTEPASATFVTSGNDLQMLITKPNEIGTVKCTNFMESADKTRIWFKITADGTTFTGTGVPTYYSDWFNQSVITKVVIKSYTFDEVLYDVATKALSFTCKAVVDVYAIDNVTGVEGTQPAFTPTVIYKFINLKK